MSDSILKNVSIFAGLKDNILDKISDLVQRRIYNCDSVILIEEEFGDTLFIITKGSVKITRMSEDGREVILSILGEGDFFGEMSIFDGESRSANVIAAEDLEVYILRRGDFLDLLEKHPKIAITLLGEMAFRLRKSDQQIEGLSLGDAENRIGMTILRLAEELGSIKMGQVTINNIPLQKDIANMTGTSRETVSRTIKILEAKGYIKKEGRKLIILKYDKFKEKFG
jgi:CRP-like cAMP-binding protein